MSRVKWADPHELTDEPERFTTMPVIPLSALTEVVRGAVDTEEELPGEIPQEMYDTIINGDKEIVTEAFRIVVRATKKSIKQRILAQLTEKQP